jgi:RNA polymerase sigma factor (sigma-70 family)
VRHADRNHSRKAASLLLRFSTAPCDLIEDQNAIRPIDAMIQSNLRETTTRVLASLTPREERTVRMRFGLGVNSDHSLPEVGQQFSVSRERIRQIETKALRKAQAPEPIKGAPELPR